MRCFERTPLEITHAVGTAFHSNSLGPALEYNPPATAQRGADSLLQLPRRRLSRRDLFHSHNSVMTEILSKSHLAPWQTSSSQVHCSQFSSDFHTATCAIL
jgi:hypothetical protein